MKRDDLRWRIRRWCWLGLAAFMVQYHRVGERWRDILRRHTAVRTCYVGAVIDIRFIINRGLNEAVRFFVRNTRNFNKKCTAVLILTFYLDAPTHGINELPAKIQP